MCWNWKSIQIEIKGAKPIYIVVLLSIIIIVGWFYWFQLRPTQIRKECSEELRRAGSLEARELFYKTCLREKGIDK